MNSADQRRRHALLCPSAQPEMADCEVLGTFEQEDGKPRLAYLNQHVPLSGEILALAGEAAPTQVFRFAAPCEEKKCMHFDGRDCKLATRIVQILPAVVSALPPCIVRADCRWYAQEGGAACLRCPQIMTLNHDPSEELKMAAGYTPGEVPAGATGV